MSYDHDEIANRLAKKFKTKHRRKGVDIISNNRAMEVATSQEDLHQSVPQLNRSRAAKKYMVVPPSLYKKTKKLLKDTGIGMMNTNGNIKKRSRKKKQ